MKVDMIVHEWLVHLTSLKSESMIGTKVLNIGYRDRIGWRFFISDIEDTRAYQVFILDVIYNEILIIKS